MKKICIVYTTVSMEQDAMQLAEQAVHADLAACVNCSPIQSVYRWQGKVEKEQEYALLFKTSVEKRASLTSWIKAHHPYEVPALWWRTVAASDEYVAFVEG